MVNKTQRNQFGIPSSPKYILSKPNSESDDFLLMRKGTRGLNSPKWVRKKDLEELREKTVIPRVPQYVINVIVYMLFDKDKKITLGDKAALRELMNE